MSQTGDLEKGPHSTCGQTEAVAFAPTCRAKEVGSITEFAECLAQEPVYCSHRLFFGDSRFCFHPRRQEIVVRTRQTGAS